MNACGGPMLARGRRPITPFRAGNFAGHVVELRETGVVGADHHHDGTLMVGSNRITRASRWVSMPRAARASPTRRMAHVERCGLRISAAKPFASKRSASRARVVPGFAGVVFLKPGRYR